MQSRVEMTPVNFSPALRQKLARRRLQRICVSPEEIRTKVIGKPEAEIAFRLYQRPLTLGTYRLDFRLLATTVDTEPTLLPNIIGCFDYSLYKDRSEPLSVGMASCRINYDLASAKTVDEKAALCVTRSARQLYRGLGRSLCSIAFNHAIVEGMTSFYIGDVISPSFWYSVTRSISVARFTHDSRGDLPVEMLAEVDFADPDITIDLEAKLRHPVQLSHIQVSLRSIPLALVLADLRKKKGD